MNRSRTLCVMGTFDQRANHTVTYLKERLRMQGIAVDAYEPHITLGIYTGVEAAPLCAWAEGVAAQHQGISLCFNHFGFFPDAAHCFIAPCPSEALLRLHCDIRQKYDDCCIDRDCLYSLHQKSWAPHMTLATLAPGQAERLLDIFRADFSPFTAELIRLKITASDTSEHLAEFDLGTPCPVCAER